MRVVATRPKEQNGLGLAPENALHDLADLTTLFPVLRDERAVFDHWMNLLHAYAVRGKTAHDARIVAAMKRHGVEHLLTFNTGDFKRYQGITLLDPAKVAGREVQELQLQPPKSNSDPNNGGHARA